MANQLLTPQAVTREALRLFKNSNAFLQAVDRQYDNSFAQTGAKIGTSLKIRLPNDYVVRSGPTAAPQDTVENSTTLTVATQKGVDIAFSSVDRTMSLDDYSTRVLMPMMNNLGGAIAMDLMSGSEAVNHLVHNVDGSNNTISPNLTTWATAGGLLDAVGAPRGQRAIILDPITQARTVSSFSGLFNDQAKIGKQYTSGVMGRDVLGFDWMMDQTVLKHTVGAYGTMATVNGANQTGTAITVSALNGPLNKGDTISFAGVFGVNRVTKASTGVLAQFAVTANVAAGATSIPIYPALIPQAAGASVAYQTVFQSPANGAAITSPTNAGETYRKNIAMVPQAVTLATADLEIPKGVHEAYRDQFDGVSMRLITAYNVTTDQFVTRLDILYGYTWIRPEWAVVVADSV